MNELKIRSILFYGTLLIILTWALFVTGCGHEAEFAEVNSRRKTSVKRAGTPIPLKADKENKGERCEVKPYEGDYDPKQDTPEYKRCSKLQKELNQAARVGNIEGIRGALEDGANVRAGYYQEGGPLGVAITVGQVEAVLLLIENGADVNVKYKWNQTPLHYAVIYNFSEIAKILIENGADVCSVSIDDRTEQKPTALDIAKKDGHREMIVLLKGAGAEQCP